MTDDRTETITDPAEIRATDEPDERGDFPCCTTPAPSSGAGLDLDALHETICDNFTGMAEVRQAADALIAEVRSLRAKVAAVEAEKEAILGQVDQAARLLRLNGKQADAQTVIAQVRRWPEFVDRAALATTGEGQ